MLDHLKKVFSTAASEVQAAENPATPLLSQEMFAEMAEKLEGSTAQLADLSAQLTEMTEKFSATSEKLAKAEEIINTAEATKAALLQEAHNTKMATRKEALVQAVGTVKADALLTATEQLDESSFASIVTAMSLNIETEASTFQEQGVGAKASEEVFENKPTHFNKFIKNKQGK